MLVQIRCSPSGPLKVIEELPNAKLAMLEGLNGIGKTLAVRLLEICTGTMPYKRESAAWQSLCTGIGSLEVEITGLRGAKSVVWQAQTAEWLDRDETRPTTNWFSSITIDGEHATLDSVRRLIVVHRLAGDEGITDIFATVADSYASALSRWRTKHTDPAEGPLATLERAVDEARSAVADHSPADLPRLQDDIAETLEILEQRRAEATQLQRRRVVLEEALTVSRRLKAMRQSAPELTQALKDIDAQIRSARSDKEAADHDVERLAGLQARSESLRKELSLAQQTLARNRSKLASTLRVASARATELEVDPTSDSANKLIGLLEQELTTLHAEHAELDASPAMSDLLRSLIMRLRNARDRGLGDQLALDDPETSLTLTVSRTQAGIRKRLDDLVGQPPPPGTADLVYRIEQTTEGLRQARSLRSALQEVSRYQRLVNKNEERVDKALRDGAGGAAARRLEEASNRRRECDQVLLDLASNRAAIAQRLGVWSDSASEQALTVQLQARLEEAATTEHDLEADLETTRASAAVAEQRVADSRTHLTSLERERAAKQSEIKRTFERLATDNELNWMRSSLGLNDLQPYDDAASLLPALETSRSTIAAVGERLGSHRVQIAAIERALEEVAHAIRGRTGGATEYVNEMQTWLAKEITDWFNDPLVRNELLPDSTQDATVDLTTKQVIWREGATQFARPIDAFSSGEQAFAYTKARLALLDRNTQSVANRLIVLDEFGAFIAHDRFTGLLNILKRRAEERSNDQVLVILPLSSDYSQLARSAFGDQAKLLTALAHQVAQRRYAVRTLAQ